MVEDSESHNTQSHVYDGCRASIALVYGSVNPTKVHDEDEAAKVATCYGIVAIEAINGVKVDPTEIVDESDVETTHKAVCLVEGNRNDEYAHEDELATTNAQLDMVIALTKEKNEEKWYGFSYQIDKLFEYTCTQPIEVDDENAEEINEYVEPIFMHWSYEEIRFYYALMSEKIYECEAQVLKGEQFIKDEDGQSRPKHPDPDFHIKVQHTSLKKLKHGAFSVKVKMK